jgi:hypothetical protein
MPYIQASPAEIHRRNAQSASHLVRFRTIPSHGAQSIGLRKAPIPRRAIVYTELPSNVGVI